MLLFPKKPITPSSQFCQHERQSSEANATKVKGERRYLEVIVENSPKIKKPVHQAGFFSSKI